MATAIVKKGEMAARSASVTGSGVYWSSSGGSGGRAVCFPVDVEENHEQRRRLAARMASAGVLSSESIVLNMFPSRAMVRSQEIFCEFSELCGATVLPAPINAGLAEGGKFGYDEAWAAAERFGANTLAAMPSALTDFAHWCDVEGRRRAFDVVLFAGEFLHPQRRAMLAERFDVQRFAAVYGSAEMGIIGYTAEATESAVYRVPHDIATVEVHELDAQGIGNLVVTNVVRRRFPVVRFDTGDRGRILEQTQDETFIELCARDSDTFEFAGGYHELSRLGRVLDSLGEWQLTIGRDAEGVERLMCSMASETVMDRLDERQLVESLRYQLDPYGGAAIEVQKIPGNQFGTRGVSDKRPKIIDLRQVTT